MDKLLKEQLNDYALFLANQNEQLALLLIKRTIAARKVYAPKEGLRWCKFFISNLWLDYIKKGVLVCGNEMRMNTGERAKNKHFLHTPKIIKFERKSTFVHTT